MTMNTDKILADKVLVEVQARMARHVVQQELDMEDMDHRIAYLQMLALRRIAGSLEKLVSATGKRGTLSSITDAIGEIGQF